MSKGTNKPRTESDPFISLNLRAFVESKDPYEQAAVTALVFWHWWKGNNEGLGIEGLAALGKMSPAKAKAVASEFKKRGWIETQRDFGGKTCYRLTVEKMTFRDAYRQVTNWLPQSQMDADQLDLWQPSTGHQVANNEPPQSPPNSKRLDLQTDKTTDTPPAKPTGGKHPDQDRWWKGAQAIWEAKHLGKELQWPVGKAFNIELTKALTNLGADELNRRWENLVNDPWATASLRTLLSDPDKYITRREKITTAPKSKLPPWEQEKLDRQAEEQRKAEARMDKQVNKKWCETLGHRTYMEMDTRLFPEWPHKRTTGIELCQRTGCPHRRQVSERQP